MLGASPQKFALQREKGFFLREVMYSSTLVWGCPANCRCPLSVAVAWMLFPLHPLGMGLAVAGCAVWLRMGWCWNLYAVRNKLLCIQLLSPSAPLGLGTPSVPGMPFRKCAYEYRARNALILASLVPYKPPWIYLWYKLPPLGTPPVPGAVCRLLVGARFFVKMTE